MTITAKIICDSVSSAGKRITTMELTYPRFIHSEFLTHRVFSRNSASSRAIPIEKMIKSVMDNPAMPIHWGRNQPGMQAQDKEVDAEEARALWLEARNYAVEVVTQLNELGLHKQIANRLLEPFMHMTTLVTATEWDNFFALRISKEAQPEINALAIAMKTAMDESEPIQAIVHLPYLSNDYIDDFNNFDDCLLASAARCCRVSYLNHGGESDVEKDIELAKKLMKSGHWSPFEHQALSFGIDDELRSNNFIGWIQYRSML
jgi:thymidylate synthase ThyX